MTVEQHIDGRTAEIISNLAKRAETPILAMTPLPSGLVEVDFGFKFNVFYNPQGWRRGSSRYRWNLAEKPNDFMPRGGIEIAVRQSRAERAKQSMPLEAYSHNARSLRTLALKIADGVVTRPDSFRITKPQDDGSSLYFSLAKQTREQKINVVASKTHHKSRVDLLKEHGRNPTDVFSQHLSMHVENGQIKNLDMSMVLLNGIDVALLSPPVIEVDRKHVGELFFYQEESNSSAIFNVIEDQQQVILVPVMEDSRLDGNIVSDQLPLEIVYGWYNTMINHIEAPFQQAGLIQVKDASYAIQS